MLPKIFVLLSYFPLDLVLPVDVVVPGLTSAVRYCGMYSYSSTNFGEIRSYSTSRATCCLYSSTCGVALLSQERATGARGRTISPFIAVFLHCPHTFPTCGERILVRWPFGHSVGFEAPILLGFQRAHTTIYSGNASLCCPSCSAPSILQIPVYRYASKPSFPARALHFGSTEFDW
jgi:hypothetical protein